MRHSLLLTLLLVGCGASSISTENVASDSTAVDLAANWVDSLGADSSPDSAGVPDARDDGLDASDETTSSPDALLPPDDVDHDGIPDDVDNCVDAYNLDQWDSDGNGVGDACQPRHGTPDFPFILPGKGDSGDYHTEGNTCDAPSDMFDSYPPNTVNESGPEVVYAFAVDKSVIFHAEIAFPEPPGTDVDLQLLSSLSPLVLIQRGHFDVSAILAPGGYYLVLDTYVEDGVEMCGPYQLTVSIEPVQVEVVDGVIPLSGAPSLPLQLPFHQEFFNDTLSSETDEIDSYPPEEYDMSGPEVVYSFTVDRPVRVSAVLRTPEPMGVDVDVHLLSSLSPPVLVERGDRSVYAVLEPGTWYLSVDSYVANGEMKGGPYYLLVSVRERLHKGELWFNDAVLCAVDYIYANYGLLGYDSAVLTHDISYGDKGVISATGGARTMCVAAVMEMMLQGMILYAEDTGDPSVFDFLPKSSWETLDSSHIKAHIWVNHDLDSWGTADALRHFGMGENIPFEELAPGSFVNINRTTGSGHAVVFMHYIDSVGDRVDTYGDEVVGFRYFSSQGGYAEGQGGMDYRYAIFDSFGALEMPYNRDLNIIYSENQNYLNTGMMYGPSDWSSDKGSPISFKGMPPSKFDPIFFDGCTADDLACRLSK